jgi:hypothetical protein
MQFRARAVLALGSAVPQGTLGIHIREARTAGGRGGLKCTNCRTGLAGYLELQGIDPPEAVAAAAPSPAPAWPASASRPRCARPSPLSGPLSPPNDRHITYRGLHRSWGDEDEDEDQYEYDDVRQSRRRRLIAEPLGQMIAWFYGC